ncbi:carboxypeptidase M32, partial [Hungatella effluvii]
VWTKSKAENDFGQFVPVLQRLVDYQKKFASYRAKKGEKLYDSMLDLYEKDFNMELLDAFFEELKEVIVPLIREIRDHGKPIEDGFLTGDYPEDRQREAAEYLANYVGFDFKKGVMGISTHPFTTNLHNHDVRITTHYSNRMDSSVFSVIHETGHAIYELGISDELTQTLVGQGASTGMHECQSRFFENIIGRSAAFWVPLYEKLQSIFPEQLEGVSREQFVEAINKAEPGLIRTEADELTYSLHVMIRYEIEKMMIEENLDLTKLPDIWADKYEEYLGIRPANAAEGVLQDIHWSEGCFGYFPSYALGSAFGAQLYYHMKKEMDINGLLENGEIGVIREYLREHIHRFGKRKTSRDILKDITGEDFNPRYYVRYLKEKYSQLYDL